MASVASHPDGSVRVRRGAVGATALVLAFIGLLSIVGLNLLHTPAVFDDLLLSKGESSALLGHGRLVRGDEYLVETPIALSQARSGSHETLRIGTTASLVPRSRQDADVHAYAPGPPASMIFRPLNLWFLVLGPSSAVIARQWSVLALGLVAFALFVRRLAPGLRRGAVAALAVSAVFSPVMMWWFTTTHHLAVAFGVLSCTMLVLPGSRRRVVMTSMLAGYVGGLGAVTTYPAFFLGSILVSALCVAPLWWRSSHRTARVLLMGAVGALTIGSFWLANRTGLQAVLDTVYPGARRSFSGEDSIVRAMTGPFSRVLTDDRPTGYGNQTELASPLYLFPAAVLALGVVEAVRRVRRSFRGTPMLPDRGEGGPADAVATTTARLPVGPIVGLAILGGWASGLLPTSVGRLLGFGGVPGARTVMGQMVACTALGAWLVARGPVRKGSKQLWVAIAASGLVAAAMVVEGLALRRRVTPSHLALREVVLYAALFAASVLGVIMLRSSTRRALVAAGLSLALSAGVQPLSIGLGPEDQLARNIRVFAVSDAKSVSGGSRWAAHEDVRFNAVVTASGLDSLSGVYFVPDRALWSVLDPQALHENEWNRYAHVVFRFGAADAEMAPPRFRAVQADAIVIDIGLCRPELRQLGLRYVVSMGVLDASCVERRAAIGPGDLHVVRLRSAST